MVVKYVDLDALNKPVCTLCLDGKKVDIMPPTLTTIINLSNLDGDNIGQLEIDKTHEIVSEVTGWSLERVKQLSHIQIRAVVEALGEEVEEEAEKNSQPLPMEKTLKSTSRS